MSGDATVPRTDTDGQDTVCGMVGTSVEYYGEQVRVLRARRERGGEPNKHQQYIVLAAAPKYQVNLNLTFD